MQTKDLGVLEEQDQGMFVFKAYNSESIHATICLQFLHKFLCLTWLECSQERPVSMLATIWDAHVKNV